MAAPDPAPIAAPVNVEQPVVIAARSESPVIQVMNRVLMLMTSRPVTGLLGHLHRL
jgi:hypothetical protein